MYTRIIALLLGGAAWITSAATFTVTNGNDSGAGSLRDTILGTGTGAGTDHIIVFDAAVTTVTLTSGAIIVGSRNLEIRGAGNVTIDGSGNSDHALRFNSSSRTWVVDGLTFTNFANPSGATGGVIRMTGVNSYTMTISNCIFANNSNPKFWGGVIGTENGDRWTLNIDTCTFTNNSAGSAGFPRNGGALFLKSTSGSQNRGIANVTNCSFSSNTSAGNGGTVYCQGNTLIMADCIFTSNESGVVDNGQGGALFLATDRTVPSLNTQRDSFTNCQFIGNKGRSGGAIRIANKYFGDFTDCTFSGNEAIQSAGGGFGGGGAIYREYADATALSTDIVFAGCIFANNRSDENDTAADGGAIRVLGAGMSVANCSFSGNTSAFQDGGAIAMDDTGGQPAIVNVVDSRVTGNTANQGGGIMVYAGASELTLENTEIDNNTTTGLRGGGVYLDGGVSDPSYLTADGCNIHDNTAIHSSGGIHMNGSYDIRNTDFTDNTAGIFNSSFTGGGAMRIDRDNSNPLFTDALIEDCTFTRNLARQTGSPNKGNAAPDGGALYLNYCQGLVIRRCSFTDNEADDQGGAIIQYQAGAFPGVGDITLEDCTFTGNTADGGGALRLLRVATVNRCTFNSNVGYQLGTSFSSGGALLVDSNNSVVTVQNSTFCGNNVEDRGGAISQTANSSLKIYNCTIVNNSSLATNSGGAIRFLSAAAGRISEIYSTIIADNSDGNGGTDEDIEGDVDVFENNLIRDVDGFTIGGVATPGSISGTNVQNVDPLLGALQNNGGLTSTMEPGQTSPVIDVGSNVLALTGDQRGSVFPRAIDHAATAPAAVVADIGAVELAADDILDFTITATPNITLRLSASGNSYEIVNDASGTVIASQTVTSTNTLDINGLAASADTLTVDFSNGNPIINGATAWDADTGADSLIVSGGSHTTVTYTANGPDSGIVDYDGSSFTYSGLAPITDNGSAVNRVFTVNIAGAQQLRLIQGRMSVL